MTSSRPFDLGIEIRGKMFDIANLNNLTVTSEQIDATEIKRTTIKNIRIEAHKIFNNLDLMTYGREYSKRYSFTNSKGDTLIECKTLLLGDHLRILEIKTALKNNRYKKDFEANFIKEHITWLDKN